MDRQHINFNQLPRLQLLYYLALSKYVLANAPSFLLGPIANETLKLLLAYRRYSAASTEVGSNLRFEVSLCHSQIESANKHKDISEAKSGTLKVSSA